MRIAEGWKDYRILDTSGGEKLESWGGRVLIRPDPQVIWNTPKEIPEWNRADAHYHRSNKGGGQWELYKKLPESWTIGYRELTFRIRPTGFKHTGLFPEQAVNWDLFHKLIQGAGRPVKILNLFAYTGGATLACLRAGAQVCHVDASKGMVGWARENAALSGLSDKPVRWIVDDCEKFVAREIRRGSFYDGVIMDPPSYGRGPGGEVWKLEDQVVFRPQLLHHGAFSLGDGLSAEGHGGKTLRRGRDCGRNRPAGGGVRLGSPLREHRAVDCVQGISLILPAVWKTPKDFI